MAYEAFGKILLPPETIVPDREYDEWNPQLLHRRDVDVPLPAGPDMRHGVRREQSMTTDDDTSRPIVESGDIAVADVPPKWLAIPRVSA